MMRRITEGKMDRGATNPPDRDDNNGKEVNGRQISAIAQRISQIPSHLIPNLPDVSIMQSSLKQFSSVYC